MAYGMPSAMRWAGWSQRSSVNAQKSAAEDHSGGDLFKSLHIGSIGGAGRNAANRCKHHPHPRLQGAVAKASGISKKVVIPAQAGIHWPLLSRD
jgi:hypothetical protein